MVNNSTYYWISQVQDKKYVVKGINKGNVSTYPQYPTDWYSASCLYLAFKSGEAIRSFIWDK